MFTANVNQNEVVHSIDDCLLLVLNVNNLVNAGLHDVVATFEDMKNWPARYFAPAVMGDYCMGDLSSRGVGFAPMVTGSGGRYPSAECGRFVF